MSEIIEKTDWMNVEELSKYLKCSKGTLYNLINKDKIPYKHINGIGIRFNRLDIENWMLEGGTK